MWRREDEENAAVPSALNAAPVVVVVVVVELVRPGGVCSKSLLATRRVPVSLVTFLTEDRAAVLSGVLSRTVSVLVSIVSCKGVSIVSFRSVSVLLFGVRPPSDSPGDASDVVEVVEAECTVLPANDGGSGGFGSFLKKPKKSIPPRAGVGSQHWVCQTETQSAITIDQIWKVGFRQLRITRFLCTVFDLVFFRS